MGGESVLDLVDYCHRRLVALLALREGEGQGGVVEELEGEEGSEEEEEEGGKERKQIQKVSGMLG